MRLGVMWPPGERPGVMRPGVRPSASKSKSGAYDTCTPKDKPYSAGAQDVELPAGLDNINEACCALQC